MYVALGLLVQLLWIVFTTIGLIVFGYYPATIAAFKTIRHFKNNDESLQHLPKYFSESFFGNLKVGSVIGIGNLFILYLLITNIRLTSLMQSSLSIYIFTLLLFFLILFLIVQPFILMVMSVSKDTLKKTIACAILLAYSSPISCIVIVLLMGLYILGIWLIPSLYMVIGITVPILLLVAWGEQKISLIISQSEELVTS